MIEMKPLSGRRRAYDRILRFLLYFCAALTCALLVAIIELGVEEIMVIGHTDCGVQHIDSDIMIHHMKQRGISQESIDLMKYCGIDFEKWLAGFDTVEQSVTDTVETIRNHPLMPHDIRIGGYVIDSITGEVSTVCKAE